MRKTRISYQKCSKWHSLNELSFTNIPIYHYDDGEIWGVPTLLARQCM